MPEHRSRQRWGGVATVAAVALSVALTTAWSASPAAAEEQTTAAAAPIAFSPPYRFTTGRAPSCVDSGDFDEDGLLDLVSADVGSDDVGLLRNLGGGRFARAVLLDDIPGEIQCVRVADMNGDGHADLVVAHGDVTVLLGNGAGRFAASGPFAAHSYGDDMVIADFNADGVPDVAVPLALPQPSEDDVSVLLGDGAGGLLAAVSYPTGDYPRSVDVGDLNSDGNLDLVVPNSLSEDLSILYGDGSGGFAPAVNTPLGSPGFDATVGDFQGDGFADVAIIRGPGVPAQDTVAVLRGDGQGGFTSTRDYQILPGIQKLSAADLDADGLDDLLIAVWSGAGAPGSAGSITVAISDGEDGFYDPVINGVTHNPSPPEVADLNGDGTLDLASGTENGASSTRRGATVTVLYQRP